MRAIPILKAIIFIVAITLPMGVLVLGGAEQPYGRPHTAFPPLARMIEGKPWAFEALANALFDRSPATKVAIQTRNGFSLATGDVDTPQVVSGKDGWLFFKVDWHDGECLTESDVAPALATLDMMQDMAAVADIDMRFVIAPNKTSVFPEEFSPRFRFYARCSEANADLIRALLPAEAPRVIDHRVPLLAAKSVVSGKLYWKTDTHWTPLGAAIAFRQLLEAIYPEAGAIFPPRVTGDSMSSRTDMLNVMLLQNAAEEADALDTAAEQALGKLRRFDDRHSTTILGDSFYQVLSTALLPFNDAVMLNVEIPSDPGYVDSIRKADRLIIETVERALLRRITTGPMRWTSLLGETLLGRIERVAEGCGDFAPAKSADGTIRIPDAGQGLPCLTLEITAASPSVLEIFLPRKTGGDGDDFEPGRSIRIAIPAGTTVRRLVLPAYAGGRNIRIAEAVTETSTGNLSIVAGTGRLSLLAAPRT